MRTLLSLALTLCLLSPTLALAQGHASEARTEVFDDADQVTGTVESPDVDMIGARRRHMRHSLVTPRAHFIPEMLRSVENL